MEIYKLAFSPLQVNTYLLAGRNGDCAIIDCSCYTSNEFDKLVKFIESKKLKPVMLLNTHCHLDHIFGNLKIQEKYGLRTHCHQLEEDNRRNSVSHALLFGLTMEEPPAPEAFISDRQTIDFAGIKLLSLFVPGHTAGGLAFYNEEYKCVFTGDTLFAGSIGRTDLHGGNYNAIIKSIKEQLLTLPPDTKVYPGHGPETTIAIEIESNPYLT